MRKHIGERYSFTDHCGVTHKVGINFVVTTLALWLECEMQLTWDEWEQLTGFVHDLLDDAYDSRHMLPGPEGTESKETGEA